MAGQTLSTVGSAAEKLVGGSRRLLAVDLSIPQRTPTASKSGWKAVKLVAFKLFLRKIT
jgi:hypothetical protein